VGVLEADVAVVFAEEVVKVQARPEGEGLVASHPLRKMVEMRVAHPHQDHEEAAQVLAYWHG
jgi:ribosomal protein S5